MVETIDCDGRQLALIVRHQYTAEGIQFFTPNTYSQQLGYMKRPRGYVIPPHVHNPVKREVEYTKEVLVIKRGVVRVDFYSDDQVYLCSTTLSAGDIILLPTAATASRFSKKPRSSKSNRAPTQASSTKRASSLSPPTRSSLRTSHDSGQRAAARRQ